MHVLKILGTMALIAASAMTSGCIVEADYDEPPPDYGRLTVFYTIEGTTDPSTCDYYGVTDAELIIYNIRGAVVLEQYETCYDFQIGARLSEGTYDADLTLVDAANRARSVTKPLESLNIIEKTELTVDVDFPAPSML